MEAESEKQHFTFMCTILLSKLFVLMFYPLLNAKVKNHCFTLEHKTCFFYKII